jgi:glycosyltransferase involved in cell wall biosynthesis
LRKKFSFRLVVSLHGDEILKWFDEEGLFVSTEKRLNEIRPLISILKEADAVTACSGYLLEKAIELAPEVRPKGYVACNGVDLERFEKKTRYLHTKEYCLAYGRLIYRKGFDLLIDAFLNIARKYPDLDLILAGEGEQGQALETQVSKLGLEDRVVFFGRAQPEQVVDLLNGCRFAIIPSRNEPFGIVALEIMAAGKAMVATRVGGLPEFVDEAVNPMVCPSVKGLAGGMEKLLLVNNLEMIGLRNQKAVRELSWEKTGEDYFRVIASMIRKDV